MSDESTKDPIEKLADALEGDNATLPGPVSQDARDRPFAPQPPDQGSPEWPDDSEADAGVPDIDPGERRTINMELVARSVAEPQNDTGNGQRLLAHFGQEILNVREMTGPRDDGWHVWTGERWQGDGGNEAALLRAQRTAPRIQLEADFITATPSERVAIEKSDDARIAKAKIEDKPRDQWTDADRKRMIELECAIADGITAAAALEKRQVARRRFAVSSGNGARLREMLKQAVPHRTVAIKEIDADPYAFNCANGTLRFFQTPDLECPDPNVTRMKWEVRLDGHEPADLISRMSPVEYKAAASAPKFISSLERFQPNRNLRRFLHKYIGYSLTGLNGEQCMLFNHGGGANWKSTFIEMICRVMGDYSETLKFESIAEVGETTGAQANPDFARLPGARLVRVTEPSRGMALKEGLIKSLTSGEPWQARHNFGNFFTFYPGFKMVLGGNHKPDIGGVDHGIWRRIRFLIWPVTIKDDERREWDDVIAELWEEREGILAWLVEGALAYLNEGLAPPAEMIADTEEYRDEMDPVGSFISACVTLLEPKTDAEKHPDFDPPMVTATDMFDAFERWCADNGVRPWRQKSFGSALSQKGFKRHRKPGQRRYVWVSLHDVPARLRGHRADDVPHPADSDEEVPA